MAALSQNLICGNGVTINGNHSRLGFAYSYDGLCKGNDVMFKPIDTQPLLRPLNKPDWWILEEEYEVDGITVPAGFYTDLDSVYRLPFIYVLFKGHTRVAALVHDWLYTTTELSRKAADKKFYELLLREGVAKWRAKGMYFAVRIMGEPRYGAVASADVKEPRKLVVLKQEFYLNLPL